MTARTAAPKPGYILDKSQPLSLQAASLALAMMGAAGCNTWAELAAEGDEGDELRQKVRSKASLTEQQGQLLDRFTDVLSWLHKGVSPNVTVAVCPVCENFTSCTNQAPNKCFVVPGCEGKPVRASAAKRTQKPKPQAA